MHHHTTLRVGLAALAVGAGLAALPAAANASDCARINSTGVAQVTNTIPNTPLYIGHNDAGQIYIQQQGNVVTGHVTDGPVLCQGLSTLDVVATLHNTTAIKVKGQPGVKDFIVINEQNGLFVRDPDGIDPMKITGATGTGGDELQVLGPLGFKNRVSISNTLFGVQIDQSSTTVGPDIVFGTGSDRGRVSVYGGNADDQFFTDNAFLGVSSFPTEIHGWNGNDYVHATENGFGNAKDTIFGEAGDDTVYVNDNVGGDKVDGGAGQDFVIVDTLAGQDSVANVEFGTKIGELDVAKKVVKAKAGGEAKVSFAWEHPTAWKQLERVKVTLLEGTKTLGSLTVEPAKHGSAKGSGIELVKVGHAGKKVTETVSVRVPKSAKGKQLSLDVQATDRAGNTEVFRQAALIHVS